MAVLHQGGAKSEKLPNAAVQQFLCALFLFLYDGKGTVGIHGQIAVCTVAADTVPIKHAVFDDIPAGIGAIIIAVDGQDRLLIGGNGRGLFSVMLVPYVSRARAVFR